MPTGPPSLDLCSVLGLWGRGSPRLWETEAPIWLGRAGAGGCVAGRHCLHCSKAGASQEALTAPTHRRQSLLGRIHPLRGAWGKGALSQPSGRFLGEMTFLQPWGIGTTPTHYTI